MDVLLYTNVPFLPTYVLSIHMYTYLHTYIRTYTHTYVRTYRSIMYVRMYVHTHNAHMHLVVMSYTFMLTTSREPNTVTVTALKTQDTPTTAACTLGMPQIRNTLSADRKRATTAQRQQEVHV